jgi:hypothetical protein
VALVALVSGGLWLCKRGQPWSGIVATWSYGLSNCLRQSLDFDYIHQSLPVVASMIAIASLYTFRRREISRALREHRFWETAFYREWVHVLILVFMGILYSYSGIMKIAYGGWDAGNGLKLQLIFDALAPNGPLTWPIVQYRPLATLLMTATVVGHVTGDDASGDRRRDGDLVCSKYDDSGVVELPRRSFAGR